MKGRFLISPTGKTFVERNIYADKSSLVLEWILLKGIGVQYFSLREVSHDTGISLGTVHRVFELLILKGYLQTTGIRTNKRFFIKNPFRLLHEWLEYYNITKKCKTWTYSTGLQNREQVIHTLEQQSPELRQQIVLSLHSAAEVHKAKNTTLQQLELYILQPNMRPLLEKMLKLHHKERGYDVLLIEPYYKAMLHHCITLQKCDSKKCLFYTPPLLTFLDLYHFPLRGIEQAEFMAKRIDELKRIYKKEQ